MHAGGGVGGSSLSQHGFKLAVGHSLVPQVNLLQSCQFLVGIGHILQLVNKPGVALGVGVGQGHVVAHDEIFGVEHVDDWPHRGATGNAVELTIGLLDGTDGALHLWGDVGRYQLVVAAQLGGVVATHRLVVEARLVLVEGVAGKIQHAEVRVVVLQDELVHRFHGVRCLLDARIHKHRVVQVALVHRPQVNQAEHGHQPHHRHGLQLLHLVEQQQGKADDDDDERAPAVAGEHGHAHLGQVVGHHAHALRVYIARQAGGVAVAHEVEERGGQQGEEQAEASGETQ